MRSIVEQLFKAQRVFAKWVLQIALSIFVLTSIVSVVLWAMDEANMKGNLAVAERIIGTENTVGILEGKKTISKNSKEEIDGLVEDKKQILNLQVFKMSDVKSASESGSESYHINEAIPAYQYDNRVSNQGWRLIQLDYELNENNQWYVRMKSDLIFAFIPFVSLIGFAIYATLFTIFGRRSMRIIINV